MVFFTMREMIIGAVYSKHSSAHLVQLALFCVNVLGKTDSVYKYTC